MGIKTRLRCYLARIDGARLHLEVTFMMGCEDTFHINDVSFVVAGLDDWRKYAVPNGVRRIVVVMVADLTTPRFGTSNVEALRTVIDQYVVWEIM